MPSYTLPGGTIKFESEKTNGRYQALVSSGGSVTTALSGENADMSYSMTGAATGDTLTLTAKGATDFGATGPIFVMLMDAAQKDGSGNLAVRFGSGSSDVSAPTTISKFESNSAMPGGEGWRMGVDNSTFGSSSDYPFQLAVDTPEHMRSFEAVVTHLPTDKRIPIRDELVSRSSGDLWGVKRLWNATTNREFGDPDFDANADTNFFIASLYGWSAGNDYWLDQVEMSGNSRDFPNLGASVNDPDNTNSPNRYWRPEPHIQEWMYDLGSSDTSVADSEAAFQMYTSADGKFIDTSITGQNFKNTQLDSVQTPMGHFTYPGYVRGWNIGLDYNFVENLQYKAVGDGAYCRVAITDNADYFATEKHTILEVSAQADWQAGQIVARLHGGWFDLANLGGKYINVIGIDNTQIASVQVGSA